MFTHVSEKESGGREWSFLMRTSHPQMPPRPRYTQKHTHTHRWPHTPTAGCSCEVLVGGRGDLIGPQDGNPGDIPQSLGEMRAPSFKQLDYDPFPHSRSPPFQRNHFFFPPFSSSRPIPPSLYLFPLRGGQGLSGGSTNSLVSRQSHQMTNLCLAETLEDVEEGLFVAGEGSWEGFRWAGPILVCSSTQTSSNV